MTVLFCKWAQTVWTLTFNLLSRQAVMRHIDKQFFHMQSDENTVWFAIVLVDFQKVKTESKKKAKSPPEPTINTQSPYRYAQHSFPSDDILRRRPLYTPGGTLRTIPKTSSPLSATVKQFDETDGNKATKSSFPWCRLLLVVLLLCVLLVVLVYYHMEQNQVSKLPIENKAWTF